MNLHRELFQKRHSLFLKLFFIFGLTFAGLLASIGLGFKAAHSERPPRIVQKNITRYAQYLAQEIGSPPHLERAAKIHEETALDLWIHSPQGDWSTGKELPADDRRSILTKVGDTEIRFSARWTWGGVESPVQGILIGLVGSIAILIVSFVLFRRVFRPLGWMKHAALQLGEGQWSARIPLQGDGELTDLSRTINALASRVGSHMDSMRRLLASVSHELRSPLARLRMGIESVGNSELQKSLVEEVHRIDALTETILQAERVRLESQNLTLQSTDVGSWIQGIAAEYKGQITLGSVPSINHEIDPRQLRWAVRTLIDNALLHGVPAQHPPKVSLTKDSGGWQLEIADSGPGIPSHVIEHLGEPMIQGDLARGHSRPGFGMGLSLAQAIVRAHGGKLELSTAKGGRAIVSFSAKAH